MAKPGHGPKLGMNKQGWEQSEFPITCETCLGPNPYIRMIKDSTGKECKVCARPFTSFRWQPGPKARYKCTEVCPTCAKVKNVCQTCLLDLEYGLPVQVRDAALGLNKSDIPESDVHKEYFADIQQRELEGKTEWEGKAPPNAILNKLARQAPYYKRNEAHVCSFWVKGTCNRGAACPYRHENPYTDPTLAKQNTKDRYYGVNDPVANKMLSLYNKIKPLPPQDKSITTLFISGVAPEVTEQDIRDTFYGFGEIAFIHVVHRSNCAFVTYTKREYCEAAIDSLYSSLTIKGTPMKLNWSRQQYVPGGSMPSTQPVIAPLPQAQRSNASQGPSLGANFFSLPAPPPVPPIGEGYGVPVYYPSMDPSTHGSRAADVELKQRANA